MNYDDIVIGVGNPDHPANDVEIIKFDELDQANQNTWKEKCAKWRLEEKIRNAQEILNELLDFTTIENKVYEKNKITTILNIFK